MDNNTYKQDIFSVSGSFGYDMPVYKENPGGYTVRATFIQNIKIFLKTISNPISDVIQEIFPYNEVNEVQRLREDYKRHLSEKKGKLEQENPQNQQLLQIILRKLEYLRQLQPDVSTPPEPPKPSTIKPGLNVPNPSWYPSPFQSMWRTIPCKITNHYKVIELSTLSEYYNNHVMYSNFGIVVTHIRPHGGILFDRDLLTVIEDILQPEITETRHHVVRNATDVNTQVVYTYVLMAMIRSRQYLRAGFGTGKEEVKENTDLTEQSADTRNVAKNAQICFSASFCCNLSFCSHTTEGRTIAWPSRSYMNVSEVHLPALKKQREIQQASDTARPLSESELSITLLTSMDKIAGPGRSPKPSMYEFFMLTHGDLTLNVAEQISRKHPRFVGINDNLGDSARDWVAGMFTYMMEKLWDTKAPWEKQ